MRISRLFRAVGDMMSTEVWTALTLAAFIAVAATWFASEPGRASLFALPVFAFGVVLAFGARR